MTESSIVERALGIYGRLVRAQRTAQAVGKDAFNSFHRYKYASAEAVIEEARGALSEAGLCVFEYSMAFVRVDSAPLSPPEKGTPATSPGYIDVGYALASEDGVRIDFAPFPTAVILEVGRPLDKAQATARTYSLAYFLRGLLLLPREDEGAVDQRDDRPVQRQAPPPVAPAKPPEFAALQLEIRGLMENGLKIPRGAQMTAEVVRRTGKSVSELTTEDLIKLKAAVETEIAAGGKPAEGEVTP